MLALVYFILLSVIAVGCSICILLNRHPLYASIAMVTTMLSLAGIYGLLGSPFVGVVQVMVYAGAIMTLLMFIIFVLNGSRDNRTKRFDKTSLFVLVSVIAMALLAAVALCRSAFDFDAGAVKGSVDVTAKTLFDMNASGQGYYLIFLSIGLVLLSAMATAVILARKRIASDPETKTSEEVH